MATAAACILWFSIIMYAVLGGADYGAGFWDLLAGGTRRGERPRGLIDHAMAPVWEVNNVWLVLAIVACWTGFPPLFEAVFLSLYPLFTVALIGLVLRGAFFAFRHIADDPRSSRAADIVFGVSSVLTPFCFAASLGGVETTVSHPELTSHRGLTPEERAQLGISSGTVRVSAGIEAAEDIVADFAQALGG